MQRQEARRNGEFVPYSAPKKNCKDTRHLWDEKKKRRKQHFEDVKKRGKGMKKGLKVKMTMSKRQRANARPARGAARGAARGRRGYNP